MITSARARELLSYDPDTGIFMHRIGNQMTPAGERAGNGRNGHGYHHMKLLGKTYLMHRLAWLIAYGEWPSKSIDHINGDKTDNRLANLREATAAENARNSRKPSVGKNKFKGVSRTNWPGGRQFVAKIKTGGKIVHIGVFHTEEEAHAAYSQAARELFGEFARTE